MPAHAETKNMSPRHRIMTLDRSPSEPPCHEELSPSQQKYLKNTLLLVISMIENCGLFLFPTLEASQKAGAAPLKVVVSNGLEHHEERFFKKIWALVQSLNLDI